jgi:hypothetical protein
MRLRSQDGVSILQQIVEKCPFTHPFIEEGDSKMKTINRSPSSLFTAFLVIGALGAFYFYRRSGGQMRPLLDKGSDLLRRARSTVGSTTIGENIGRSLDKSVDQAGSMGREVSMSPEDMDRFPST